MDAAANAPEVMGNTTDAKFFLRFQYCGAWGYKPHVLKAIEEIEKTDMKGQFQYHLYMDQGKTGRNEVTLFTESTCAGEGTLVYSKLKTQKQPAADDETKKLFLSALMEETKKNWAWVMFVHQITHYPSFFILIFHQILKHAKTCDGFSLNTTKERPDF